MRRLACLTLLATWACGEEGPVPRADVPAADSAPAPAVADAPPGTDIWLGRLARNAEGRLTIREPVNVTTRSGYDNQPHFLPDGSGFLYTVIDGAGQADIWLHDLEEGRSWQVTRTAPESEYSGTPLEADGGFSAVRVEADSTQRLWRFDLDGGRAEVVFADIAPVGYHAWADAGTAVLFVLGDPPTLQIAKVGGGEARVVARDVGRSIQRIPGTGDVSYVQRSAAGGTEIRRLDPATGVSRLLVAGVKGGDFHTWTPDGVLLQAHEGRVFAHTPGAGEGWTEVADLSALRIRLSRMAVHPDGTWIALVGEAVGGS